MTNASRFVLIGIPGLATLAIGCASSTMPVSADLGAHAPRMGLEIVKAETYDDEGIQFGDYAVSRITHLPMTRTVDRTSGNVLKQQVYTYEVQHHGVKWKGECAAKVDSIGETESEGTYRLRCRIRPIDGDEILESWSMTVSGGLSGAALAHGEIRNIKQQVSVTSVHPESEVASQVSSAVGFDFFSNDSAVGAVQTKDGQALWIRKEISEDLQGVVATSAAGLVLFEQIQRS